MINRILGADRAADLTGKTDVPKSAWYYGDMAKAVFLGYLTVPKVALMTRAMTRQEMFAVLSGAFCLNRAHPGEAALSRFSDVSAMAGAFRVSAESLCQAGFLAGSNESLRPNERATRAEFLTLLYKITDSLKIVGCDKTIVELNAGESAVLRCGVLKSVSAPALAARWYLLRTPEMYASVRRRMRLSRAQAQGDHTHRKNQAARCDRRWKACHYIRQRRYRLSIRRRNRDH